MRNRSNFDRIMTPPDDDIQDKQDTDTLDSGRRKNHGPGFSRQSIILGLILGAVAVGFGALFLYSLSDPQRFNHDYTRIIFYYTIPIISLIAGATAVFGRPALKAKIVILLASCFASKKTKKKTQTKNKSKNSRLYPGVSFGAQKGLRGVGGKIRGGEKINI